MYKSFDLATLEREYSPSSCIDDINVFIQSYINQSIQALSIAKTKQSVMTNISYGPNEDMTLDMFSPFNNSTVKRKLQVYIHGGYWQELSKNESSFAATNFQQQGYHFAVINYSLAPKATLSEIIEQNRQALVSLYNNAEKHGYDKNEIYISGSSAGAHLAMMMALTDWSKYLPVTQNIVKGVCAVSGIYDLTPIAQTYINKPLQLTPDEITLNSPLLEGLECHVQDCELIFAYGDNETSEFKQQTNDMRKKLATRGITSIYKEIKNRNHFDVILDLAKPESWLSQQVITQMSE